MPFHTAGLNAILSDLVGANRYIGLSTTTPTESGTNFTEPATSTGYARVSASGLFGTPSNGTVRNTSRIRFPEALAGRTYGTLTYVGIFTASTGGNLLYYAPLTTPQEINADELPKFNENQLSITVTVSS